MKPNKTNVYVWSLIIVMIIISGVSEVRGAKPQALSAAYIDSTNTLLMVFDQPVFTDSTRVIRGGITLDGDDAGSFPNLTLTGGFLPGVPELSNTVQIILNATDQNFLETMRDRNSLELVLKSNSIINAAYETNDPVTVEDDIAVPFIEDMNPPVPTKVVYDANINRLTIDFSEIIEVKTISLPKISLDDDFGGPRRDVSFSSDNERILNKFSSQTIEIDISPTHQQLLESFDVQSICIKLDRNAYVDLDQNSNKVITADDQILVAYIPDAEPTVAYGGHYDAGSNTLELYFNEKIVNTFWGKDAVKYEGINIFSGEDKVALSGQAGISVFADTVLKIQVLPTDQRLIESLPDPDNLKLTLDAFSILDANGNGIRAFTLDDNLKVTYVAEDPSQAPIVTDALYDAVKNSLELNFGNITGATRGIDSINVNLAGIIIDDDMGGPNPDVTLSGGEVHGIKAGVPKFIRKIVIDVTPDDRAKIERMAQKNSLYLILEPLTFFFESYTKTRNGNHPLATGNVPIQYIPDTLAAEIKSVKYDFQENQLHISFNKLIQFDKFQPTAFQFSGINLTGGTVLDSTYTSEITIDVNAADVNNIEAISLENKINMIVTTNAGAYLNLDDVANTTISFQDGDITTLGDTVFVGYGRKFWDKSFEAFPTADQLIPASLRAVGDHSYFYVADEMWTGWREAESDVWVKMITQAQVDSLLDAFEKATPGNPDKGIYQICRDVFGQERDNDGDSRIYILLLDIRDEYGQGRNNRLNDFAKAGYFEPRNELSESVYAHSNEVDMIYIDINPVIVEGQGNNALADMFQRMISYHTDPDEERWLVEGMSAMAQLVSGFKYHTYQFPTKKLVPASQNGLTSWVDWSGGMPIDITNVLNSYFFTLYLYEQYGGIDLLQTIASDTSNGLASIDRAFATRGKSVKVADVFDDYTIACYLNIVGHPTYGDKYGFLEHKRTDSITNPLSNPLGPPAQVLIDWSSEANWGTSSPWSVNYFKIKNKDIPKFMLFNGDDETVYNCQIVPQEDAFVVSKLTLDSRNEDYLDLPTYTTDIVMVVTNKTVAGADVSPFIITKDKEPSSFVSLSILQNPSVDRLLDIYVLSKERLFQDLPYSDPKLAAEGVTPILREGPVVSISIGDKTTDMIAMLDFTNTEQSMFSYHLGYTLEPNGNYQIKISGQDMSGNNFAPDSTTIAVRKILAKPGGYLTSASGDVTLSISPNSISNDTYFTLSKAKTDNIIEGDASLSTSDEVNAEIYRLGPVGIDLLKPATLTLKCENAQQSASLGIYRYENSNWVLVGGKVDSENKTITVQINRLGDFQIQFGQPMNNEVTAIPDDFNLSQNYPNPFNPETVIRYGLPEDSRVTITIYNLLGHKVVTLVDQQQIAGYHQISWDASDQSSGVYFYRLEARSEEGAKIFTQTKKMTVIK